MRKLSRQILFNFDEVAKHRYGSKFRITGLNIDKIWPISKGCSCGFPVVNNLLRLLSIVETLAGILENGVNLTLKGPGGPSTFRTIILWNCFFRAASYYAFFLSSLAQLLALFSEKSGIRFESYATLCNRTSA